MLNYRLWALSLRSARIMQTTASESPMFAHWAKPVKPSDHLDFRNVCFRDRAAVRTVAAPKVRTEPLPSVLLRKCAPVWQRRGDQSALSKL